ncbi:MAG: cupredoxin domain-containing protein [Solirubrobacteraceae bacterium]
MNLLRLVPVAAVLLVGGCGGSSSSSSSSSTGSSAPATTTAAPAAGTIAGTLNEWSVGVSAASAPAGKVTFDVANRGKVTHEFVVLRTSKSADKLGAGSRIGESGNVGETGDIAAGESKSVTIALKPGHYSLVCNLPGHYMSGMHTDFTVQ